MSRIDLDELLKDFERPEAGVSCNWQEMYFELMRESDYRLKTLKQYIEELTEQINNSPTAKGNAIRIARSKAQAARIWYLYANGIAIEDIPEALEEDLGKRISTVTVYRALSVTEPEDRERVLEIFRDNEVLFEGVTEEALMYCFEYHRIRRLNLVSIDALKRAYGEETILEFIRDNNIQPDKFVSGEYYRQSDIRYVAKKAKKLHIVGGIDDLL